MDSLEGCVFTSQLQGSGAQQCQQLRCHSCCLNMTQAPTWVLPSSLPHVFKIRARREGSRQEQEWKPGSPFLFSHMWAKEEVCACEFCVHVCVRVYTCMWLYGEGEIKEGDTRQGREMEVIKRV